MLRFRSIPVVVVLSAMALLGSSLPAAAANATGIDIRLPGGFTLSGTILKKADGKPVANASVSVSGPVLQSASTGTDGKFSLKALATGSYTLRVSPPKNNLGSGFYTTANADRFTAQAGSATEITVNANVSGITMKLPGQKTFSIAGKITRASDGTPVANASVSVSDPVFDGATTNSQGVYKISGLLAGEYVLDVSPPDGANLQTGCFEAGSAGNFTAACGGASTLKITSADLTGRNVALPKGKNITGKVVSGDVGVASAAVVAISQDDRSSGFASTNSSGNFTIGGLAPGRYKFSIDAPYGTNLRSGFWTDATANRWVATLRQAAAPNVTSDKNLGTIKPPAGFKIAGNVRGPHDAPVANVWVTATSGSNSAFGFTDFDGNYEIIGLAPGNWTLMFNPGIAAPTLQQGWYRNKSTGFTPTQAQATALTVGPNKTGLQTKLPTGFEISGRITKSGGGGVQTSLMATRVSDGASSSALGASDGSYKFTGLGAGGYIVQAFSPSGANLLGGFYKAGAGGNYTPTAGQATKVPVGP
jgi:hypothetical protein